MKELLDSEASNKLEVQRGFACLLFSGGYLETARITTHSGSLAYLGSGFPRCPARCITAVVLPPAAD
jgi:hypothetical protein